MSRYLWARRDGGEIQRGRWREGGGGGLSHHRVVACKERELWTRTYLSRGCYTCSGKNVPRSADCGEKDGGSLNCGGVGDCRIRGLYYCFFHTENPKMYLFLKSFQHCYSIIMGVATCHSCPVYYGDQAHGCVHIQGQVLDHDQAKDH